MPVALRSKHDPMYDDQTNSYYPSALTRVELESVVKLEWLDLYNHSKPCGAKALRQHLRSIGIENPPSENAIGRMLKKQGLLNDRYACNRQED
jgi:hypothetical protein